MGWNIMIFFKMKIRGPFDIITYNNNIFSEGKHYKVEVAVQENSDGGNEPQHSFFFLTSWVANERL